MPIDVFNLFKKLKKSFPVILKVYNLTVLEKRSDHSTFGVVSLYQLIILVGKYRCLEVLSIFWTEVMMNALSRCLLATCLLLFTD